MFVKKKKAGTKSSSLMTDLEEGDAPTHAAIYDAEDMKEILEDRLTSLQLKRNKQEKENIFSANTKLHKETNIGALYGIGSHKLDYSAMLEENRKALEDKSSSVKQPDFSFQPEDPMQEEELFEQTSSLVSLSKAAFVIDPNPADGSNSTPRPTYQRVQIQNELEEDFNNLKRKTNDKSRSPAAAAEDDEFITQDQQKSRMDEEFRLRKLDKALEEHKDSTKSSLLSSSPAKLRRDPHRRHPRPQDRHGRRQLHLHPDHPRLRRHGSQRVRRVRKSSHKKRHEEQ